MEVFAEEFFESLMEGTHFWRAEISVKAKATVDHLNLEVDKIRQSRKDRSKNKDILVHRWHLGDSEHGVPGRDCAK